MALTGNPINAQTAEKAGLVSRVVPVSQTVDEAVKVASQIASLSRPIGMLSLLSLFASPNLCHYSGHC